MAPCRSCGEGIPENSRFCPQCGASLAAETMVTRTAAVSGPAAIPLGPPSRTPSSSSSLDEGRFLPGTLLVGRYRVVALLGRGGMGEVYRANDLRLGQPVALKFLPEETAKDETTLARFYNEIRIARQVSHPNVCRVYDLGDVEGQPYLSMELSLQTPSMRRPPRCLASSSHDSFSPSCRGGLHTICESMVNASPVTPRAFACDA